MNGKIRPAKLERFDNHRLNDIRRIQQISNMQDGLPGVMMLLRNLETPSWEVEVIKKPRGQKPEE